MFAKLYFESSWSANTDILPVIVSMLTGTTNINSVPGATAKFNPALSYVVTTKSVAGWTLESTGGGSRVISAPCKDSTKKKFVRLVCPATTRISIELGEGHNGAGLLTGQASFDDGNTMTNNAIYSASTNSFPHSSSFPIEVWISASPRHFLIAANQPGYAHGMGGNGGRQGGWVSGVVEHSNSDSWLTDSSTYIPACVMTTEGNANTAGGAPFTFFRNRSRDISQPSVTDFANSVAGSKLYAYTKYGSGNMSPITLTGTNLVQLDENAVVKALLPFGARNKTALVRGGAISDLCDIYLAPSTIFKENLQIQVGDNTANRYHIWNLGFTSNNATLNFNLAVPRG